MTGTPPRALVIGTGSTGSAVAHDLALRGLAVTVVERGEIASGTTGRNHGLLHSGGRYAVKDAESAVGELVPQVLGATLRGVFAVSRPLIGRVDDESAGRELSRTFECFDHAREGVDGFVTISGGKTTTARAMAEATADVVCRQLGVAASAQTSRVPLRSYREFYRG